MTSQLKPRSENSSFFPDDYRAIRAAPAGTPAATRKLTTRKVCAASAVRDRSRAGRQDVRAELGRVEGELRVGERT